MHLPISRRPALASLALAGLASPALAAWAQAPAFPQHAITMPVPFAAGSIVANQAVAAAAPDGRTLLPWSDRPALAARLFMASERRHRAERGRGAKIERQ